MSNGMALPGGFGCGSCDGMQAFSIGIGRHQKIEAMALLNLSTMDRMQIQTTAIVVSLEKNSIGVGDWLEEKFMVDKMMKCRCVRRRRRRPFYLQSIAAEAAAI